MVVQDRAAKVALLVVGVPQIVVHDAILHPLSDELLIDHGGFPIVAYSVQLVRCRDGVYVGRRTWGQ